MDVTMNENTNVNTDVNTDENIEPKPTYRIQEQSSDSEIKLTISGRIDSANAHDVEKEVLGLLVNKKPLLTIDAGGLEYISSAGLRVVLHIKKLFSKLRIVNVSTEVYDILEMTGFTQIMDVERAYRQVSVEGAEVIGEGANGRLYRIDEDSVVKVYKNEDALPDIQMEREKARIALVLGIPTAISYDVVKVGDKYGSMFELLNASSFANLLSSEPGKFTWCVEQFADMLKLIHETEVPKGKLPQFKKTVLKWVHILNGYLEPEYYDKVLSLVDEVPEIDHMIHGDYHVKNLELQGDEVLLIDMDTLAVGHPIFELGSMYNSFIGYGEVDTVAISGFLGIPYETSVKFLYAVFASYLGTDDPLRVQEVMDKARIVGYVRMIRRAIERGHLELEDKKPAIMLWTEHLKELLGRIDTLLF